MGNKIHLTRHVDVAMSLDVHNPLFSCIVICFLSFLFSSSCTFQSAVISTEHRTAAYALLGNMDSGDELMARALGANDLLLAKKALRKKANPNGLLANGTPFLVAALRNDASGFASFLIDAGASIDILDSGTPLLLLAAHSCIFAIPALLDAGADASVRDQTGDTAIAILLRKGGYAPDLRRDVVNKLLEAGADPSGITGNGESLLSLAITRGDDLNVRLLLDAGADPNGMGPDGISNLGWALERGKDVSVNQLLDAGADPVSTDRTGYPYLVLAARRCGVPVIERLVKAGNSFEAMDKNGETPLLAALKFNKTDTATWLLDHGASALVVAKDGNSVLHLAAKNANDVLLPRLLDAGPPVNALNSQGTTALGIALEAKADSSVAILLRHGASVRIVGRSGEPLFLIRQLERYFDGLILVSVDNWERTEYRYTFQIKTYFGGDTKISVLNQLLTSLNADNYRPVHGMRDYDDLFDVIVSLPAPVVSMYSNVTVHMDSLVGNSVVVKNDDGTMLVKGMVDAFKRLLSKNVYIKTEYQDELVTEAVFKPENPDAALFIEQAVKVVSYQLEAYLTKYRIIQAIYSVQSL